MKRKYYKLSVWYGFNGGSIAVIDRAIDKIVGKRACDSGGGLGMRDRGYVFYQKQAAQRAYGRLKVCARRAFVGDVSFDCALNEYES